MVAYVFKHVQVVKFIKMDFVYAQKVKSNKMKNVLILQIVSLVLNGIEQNAKKYLVIQVLLLTTHVDAVKSQLMNVQLVLIGIVSDVSILLTSVLMVWSGITLSVNLTMHQNVQPIVMNKTENVFHFLKNVLQV